VGMGRNRDGLHTGSRDSTVEFIDCVRDSFIARRPPVLLSISVLSGSFGSPHPHLEIDE